MLSFIYERWINMFRLVSKYNPSGDQPKAISELINGINSGKKSQVLFCMIFTYHRSAGPNPMGISWARVYTS